MAGDIGKNIVNKVTQKVLGREIFKRKVSDLTVEELQSLLETQVREFREILFHEARPHMGVNEANDLVLGTVNELKSKLSLVDSSIDSLESLLFEARKEWRLQRETMGMEWGKFSEQFLSQIEEMQETQLKTIVNSLSSNLSAIETEIKKMKLEMEKQTGEMEKHTFEIQQTQQLISAKFEKLEHFLQQIGAMKIDDNMDTTSLHQKYQKILASITCPTCQFTTSEVKEGATWLCPSCKTTIDVDTKETLKFELNRTKLIALSIFNQAMTIKNSRGDIQFKAESYIPRKDVEDEFNNFQLKNQKGYSKFRILLLLGDAGVGKTWLAASICDKYSRSFPVYYFSLRGPVLQEMKALFLDNPKYYGIPTVFERIREVRKKNKDMRLLFVFDGFDEVYEEDKQRWFIYEILKALQKIPGIMILITCRRYDWFENRYYKQESGWLDVLTWKGGVHLTTYSDDEYVRVMEPLEIIAPLEEWEEHWGSELKRPFLQAIVQKLASEGSSSQLIQINHPGFFELLEKRLGIINTDHHILVQFAKNTLSKAKYLTRTSFDDQKSLSGLLSAGLIREKQQETGGYNPFPELELSGVLEETYCHYLRIWTVRLNQLHKLPEVWDEFINHQNVSTKVKDWVTLLVEGHYDIKNLIEAKSVTLKPISVKSKAIIEDDILSTIMQNIRILVSIYKKQQIPIFRLANKIQRDVNEVIESVETLISNKKLRGSIDDRGSIKIEEYILLLEDNWHIEDIDWMKLKNQLETKKQNWLQSSQDVHNSLMTNKLSDYKLEKTSKQKDDISDVLEEWRVSINTLNEQEFITEVCNEVNSYLTENLPILEDAFSKFEILDKEWKKQEHLYKEELEDSLHNIDSKIANYLEVFNSLHNRLEGLTKKPIKSSLQVIDIDILITDHQNLLTNYKQSLFNLQSLGGNTIPSIRERKQKFTHVIKTVTTTIQESIARCNNLISDFHGRKKLKRGTKSSYNGQRLHELDTDFLEETELLIGMKIPFIEKIEWNSFGYTIRNNRISGLSFYSKNLEALPNNLSNLGESIEILNLRSNQLKVIPQSVYFLDQIKILRLENNHLMNIPKGIENLKKLEELYLFNNNIQFLSLEISQLNNLQYLNLNSNQITQLPENIGYLTNLRVLDLYNNQIKSLPDSIKQISRLERIYLAGNQFSSEPRLIIDTIENQGGKVIL